MSEKEIQELLRTVQELTASVKELTAANQNLTSENARLKQKLDHMNELLLLAQRARFGQSSEKREYVLQGGEQMRLFNEAEQLQDPKAPEPTPETLVAAHTRKPKRPLDELVKDLPSKKIVLELNADQLVCDACGSKLTAIGEKFLRRELNVIPRQVEVIEYYTRTYACKACEEQTGYASFYTVETVPPLLKHSLASPSSVANVMTQKYVDGIPLYRQEQIWKRDGIELSRATLANWVIQGAIIIALLAGLYQTYRGRGTLLGGDNAAALAEYESDLADYTLKQEQLQVSADKLRNQVKSQNEYNEQSALMQIDPMNEWISRVVFYIDAASQPGLSQTEQNSLTKRLVSAYASNLNSSEVLDALLDQCPDTDELRFLTELYSVKADPESATIAVRILGTAEQAVQRMPETIKDALAAQYETLCAAIGEHNCLVLTESVYSAIDTALDETQKKNLKTASDYSDQLSNAEKALADWEAGKPQPPAGKRSLVKPVIKYAIIGFVAGAVIMCVWYAARYALSDSLKTDEDLRRWKLPVLGRIVREQKKKKFLPGLDALVDRIFGRSRRTTTEQSCALAAQNLAAALKQQGCAEAALVGRLPEELAETLTRQLNAAEPGVSFRCVGDALTDPTVARALEDADKVLLLAERYVTPCAEVEQALTLLTAWGKPALGAVVME